MKGSKSGAPPEPKHNPKAGFANRAPAVRKTKGKSGGKRRG